MENQYVEIVNPDGSIEYRHKDYENILAEAKNQPVGEDLPESELAKFDAVVYKNRRREQYPPLGEQLDKLFHDIENGTLNIDGEFFQVIKAVKDANPKPE
jgi:hypothetical protein